MSTKSFIDLKPENVLLDDWNQVKIGDFGLSNVMADGDFLKTSCGSPNYAAPEVISGRLYEGPEVDVWSCGVILYVMLCGRLPFDDDYIPNLFKKINGGIFTLPSFLTPAAKAILTSMLTVDPLKRITLKELRQKEWFNIGLPAYLQPKYRIPDALVHYDDAVITEIAKKMGFAMDSVRMALSDKENNQIKVAYQLISDGKRILADPKAAGLKGLQPFLLGSSPPKKSLEHPFQIKPTLTPEEHKYQVTIPEHLMARLEYDRHTYLKRAHQNKKVSHSLAFRYSVSKPAI
ncbi:Protein kinase [Dinochytrium kinnereticum]|nr:Protein kinase [Dinochytrium kinnereticum]